METGFDDTMHASLSAVFSVLAIAAMAVSAVAYRGWFGVYALATIAVVVGFGMASSLAIQGIEINDTPSAGGFERINAYAYFAWLVVLAVTVMRHLKRRTYDSVLIILLGFTVVTWQASNDNPTV